MMLVPVAIKANQANQQPEEMATERQRRRLAAEVRRSRGRGHEFGPAAAMTLRATLDGRGGVLPSVAVIGATCSCGVLVAVDADGGAHLDPAALRACAGAEPTEVTSWAAGWGKGGDGGVAAGPRPPSAPPGPVSAPLCR